MDMNKTLEKAKESAEEIIKGITKKDNVTAAELEALEKAVCLIEKIKSIEEYTNNGYSGNSYNHMSYPHDYDMSYMRGRDPSSGRYMSRDSRSNEGYSSRRFYDNYSGHSKRDRMIAALEEIYDNAQTDHERQFVKEWLDRIDYRN